MEIQNLVKMANQIGAFFEAMPDRAQAMEDIAGHIKRNWDPRMRRSILTHIEQRGGEGLKDIVREALQTNKGSLI
jgi:formate dehydrogenase subunit delta